MIPHFGNREKPLGLAALLSTASIPLRYSHRLVWRYGSAAEPQCLGLLLDPEALRACYGNGDDRLMVLGVELRDDVCRCRDHRDLAILLSARDAPDRRSRAK